MRCALLARDKRDISLFTLYARRGGPGRARGSCMTTLLRGGGGGGGVGGGEL